MFVCLGTDTYKKVINACNLAIPLESLPPFLTFMIIDTLFKLSLLCWDINANL